MYQVQYSNRQVLFYCTESFLFAEACRCRPPLHMVLAPPRVAVVGAGVSGLVATRTLQRRGITADCYEARATIGGRVATDDVDGFQLDHGYQILIDSYPEVRRQLDLPALELRPFAPGALLSRRNFRDRNFRDRNFRDRNFDLVADPIRRPRAIAPTLRSALGGFLSHTADFSSKHLPHPSLPICHTSPFSPPAPTPYPPYTPPFLAGSHREILSTIL